MQAPELKIPRQHPFRRPPAERRGDFNEIESGLTANQAITEARRCLQCPQPPCALLGCPITQRVPEWIGHIAEGRFQQAAAIIALRNNLAESCGKLCPQESLCESHCVVGKVSQPVAIGKLEEFIMRTARKQGWLEMNPSLQSTGKRIVIIGSGPAGLAAAEELLLRGHSVTLYERQRHLGGLLVYGIPSFKYEKDRITALSERLKVLGAEILTEIQVGHSPSITELLNPEGGGFHAVLLAIGAEKAKTPDFPGMQLQNIHLASDFLIAGNLPDDYFPAPPVRIEVGHTCAVFGGGDTASDCVRTAVRLGFKRVLCLYRRTEEEMPGRLEDRRYAMEEGVEYIYLTAPVRFLGQQKVAQVECIRMRPGERDESGRRRPVPIQGSEFLLEVDSVVLALGYSLNTEALDLSGLDISSDGFLVDERFQTSLPGVFAAGDAVHGADLIVTAARDGRAAARSIHDYLMGQSK